jgi:hypothetical protein
MCPTAPPLIKMVAYVKNRNFFSLLYFKSISAQSSTASEYFNISSWFFCEIFMPPLPGGGGGYTVLPLSVCLSVLFSVAFFSATIDGRHLIFGHKLHIGMRYCGKRFWTCQIPTSCLPTLLIFIHIEHICSFFIAFFSANIDGRNLIFRHKLHIGIVCLVTLKIGKTIPKKSMGYQIFFLIIFILRTD